MSKQNEIAEKLMDYFSHCAEVRRAYLFGSAAKNKLRPDSDVDVAVVLSEEVSTDRFFNYRLKAMTDISRLLHREIDVIVLNEAPNLLAYQILKYGVRIYEQNGERDRRLEVKVLMEYFDFLPYRRRCEDAMIQHLKKAS